MIHYRPGCAVHKIGLNITLGTWRRPWISFRWVWYDLDTMMLTSKRLRVRLFMRPFILRSKGEENVIESYLFGRDLLVVDRQVAMDMADSMNQRLKSTDSNCDIKPQSVVFTRL